jgi:hypothetical protein
MEGYSGKLDRNNNHTSRKMLSEDEIVAPYVCQWPTRI